MSLRSIVAVTGHPGAGKTTLSTALQALSRPETDILDLPGAHALIPRTESERTVYDTWFAPGALPVPSHIVVVVTSDKIRQQLSFVSQMIDLGRPLVVVLRETGRAAQDGWVIRSEKLSAQLGVPVICSPLHTHEQASQILDLLFEAPSSTKTDDLPHWRPTKLLAEVFNEINRAWLSGHQPDHSLRLIEGLRLITDPNALEEYSGRERYQDLVKAVETARAKLEASGENWTMVEISQRHAWLTQILRTSITQDTDAAKPDAVAPETTARKLRNWLRLRRR